MKKLIVLAVLVTLTGCANIKLQWSASYQTDNFAADLDKAKSK